MWLHHNDLNWHPQLWQRHRSCSPPPLASSPSPSSLLLVAVVALNQTPPHFTLDDGVSPCSQELRLRSVCPLPRPCPGPSSPLHFAACCLALPRYDCQPENVEENYISKRVLAVEGANRALLQNVRMEAEEGVATSKIIYCPRR